MKQLQKVADTACSTDIRQEKIDLLCQAFELFSQETDQFRASYEALEKQFKRVSKELKKANKNLEDKIRELSRIERMKELGEMAAQVAHEIRNPLGGIKGFASLLQRDLQDRPELQQMAAHIVEGTDHLSRLVTDVLDYARPIEPKLEPIDFIALLNEVKKHIEADSNIDLKHIKLTIDSSYSTFMISLDPFLMKSALLNLILNAIQAMPKGGTVSIVIQKKLGHLVLKIIDTGIGMSKEHLEKIYSPFFTTKLDGNGLGLHEVQKVVSAHGGTIDAHSILGQGTTFTLKIPLKGKSCP